MASLIYRRGAWELRYREPSGTRRTERFQGPSVKRPPEEALDRKAEIERGLRRRTHVSREARETTFEEYFHRWWASRRISRTREYTDESRARLHVLPHWSTWRLCDIRPTDVDDLIAKLSDRMGPTSVRHCYTLLRGPIRRAVKDGIVTDPLIDITLPAKPKIRKAFDDVLSRDEVELLVNCVVDPRPAYAGLKTNGRYCALILMGYWLGPRRNEAIGLRVCDLNPELNKTEEYRVVPCAGPVMDALVEHVAAYCPGDERERFCSSPATAPTLCGRTSPATYSRPPSVEPGSGIGESPGNLFATRPRR